MMFWTFICTLLVLVNGTQYLYKQVPGAENTDLEVNELWNWDWLATSEYDDSPMQQIRLDWSLWFYTYYRNLYVNPNGLISFNSEDPCCINSQCHFGELGYCDFNNR